MRRISVLKGHSAKVSVTQQCSESGRHLCLNCRACFRSWWSKWNVNVKGRSFRVAESKQNQEDIHTKIWPSSGCQSHKMRGIDSNTWLRITSAKEVYLAEAVRTQERLGKCWPARGRSGAGSPAWTVRTWMGKKDIYRLMIQIMGVQAWERYKDLNGVRRAHLRKEKGSSVRIYQSEAGVLQVGQPYLMC